MSLRYLKRKLLYSQNWNIGFPQVSFGDMLQGRLFTVKWLKHPYKDRFFADPFIIDVNEEYIELLAEELIFIENKGRIVRLIVTCTDFSLLSREVILELDSHLSYPAIYRTKDKIYIYPECGTSGELNIYEYDYLTHNLVKVALLSDMALADATILERGGKSYIFATVVPNTQSELWVFEGGKVLDGDYLPFKSPLLISFYGARSAGDFIHHNGELYRPAQNCENSYGESLIIQKVKWDVSNNIGLEQVLELKPTSFRYNLGLHTLNFREGVCVIDGMGYCYPVIARILNFCIRLKKKLRV